MALPSYERIRKLVKREAARAKVLAINHELDPYERDLALQAWSREEFLLNSATPWFEFSAAASAGLTIFALLALASESLFDDVDVETTVTVYFPWISATATMLDSYVDRAEDIASGDHVYVDHYPTPDYAIERVAILIERSLAGAQTLRRSRRHVVIVTSMIALYLSKSTARTPAMQENTRLLTRAGGSLTRLLVPTLRLWRRAYSLGAA